MSLSPELKQHFDELIASNDVLLFMKGEPQQPMCGFSASSAGILDQLVGEFQAVNVLADNDVREGIKEYSNWPTIPQLYVKGEFVGGADLISEAFYSGELFEMLGMEVPSAEAPEITIADDAADMIRQATAAQPGNVGVFLSINAKWQHQLNLQQPTGKEITATAGDVIVHMDPLTAQRANGLQIELEETMQGKGFKMDNPNAPSA